MDSVLIADAVSAAGLAILVLDEADRIIECNPPAARLLGLAPNDLTGMPVSGYLPWQTTRTPDKNPEQATPQGAPKAVAQDTTSRNGVDRLHSLAIDVVRWADPAGRARSTVIMRDAAAEKEIARIAQNDLIQSDNAIRGANIGVFEYDPITQTVTVSPIWRQMLELDPGDELDVQAEWASRVHPDDLAAALKPVQLCVEGLTERASCEYRLHARDRTRWRWMRTDIAVAHRDQDGNATLLVGAQTDITERKAMEAALRLSVDQFRSAFENAPIGKAIVGLDGAWLKANRALCTLLGYTEDELLRTDFQTVTHPDDLEADLCQLDLLTKGEIETYAMEKRYYRANGLIMWGQLSVGMVRNADGKPDHFIAQIIDITEQRRLEELKNEFVSVVSHELRTPLTSILGALSLLESDDDTPFPDDVQRLLFIAKTNGERLHELIDDILDFQKFSAGQMQFTLSPHPVVSLVEETLLASLSLADKFDVRFMMAQADRSLIAIIDPKRFQQVMANLLSNATKFANPGSTVEVSAERQGQLIRVSVTNTGTGIPEAFKDRVFKPFSQASSMSDLRSGGTGLGLSITKQIVEQMGGEIGFDSVLDGTTTFWFTIGNGKTAQ
ncbi:MAG: PAS domain S-box protein [Cypionkella sp.]